MMPFLLIGLIVLAIPFVAPLVSLYRISRLRGRIDELEREVETQRDMIGQLNARVYSLTRESGTPATAPAPAAAPAVMSPPPAAKPAIVVPAPPPVPTLKPPQPPPSSPPTEHPRTEPRVERLSTPLGTGPAPAVTVSPRRPADPPPPPPMPPPSDTGSSGFDWESLVGVKLFSGIAGIALLLAAVFFLRYSVEHGWLQPPVRVGIGIIVAIALLAACELSAARNYPLTANAMDASAIAILFATFFAAHALWNLIPGVVAFALLALVTAVAVALSIRRESLFIAVLGLLGGFATPALLSTGENQPVPLFAYLLLLNIGLAWVAFRQKWPALGWMTVILTAVYQWGWVFRFLTAGQLSLAMGVFLLFPLVSVSGLLVSRRTGDDSFERSALTAAVLPLLFAVYVAAVPGYGGHPWLLLSFLLILDVGLTTIAIARRQDLLFAAAGAATLAVMATLLWTSYGEPARYAVIVFTAAFVLLFAFAPAIADRFDRGFDDPGGHAVYTAPLLLFVFTVILRIDPVFAAPWLPFVVLLALVIAIAWRAVTTDAGGLYYTAAFFAIAAQASWSATWLDGTHLRTAVEIYALFGLVALGVPLLARRSGHALSPESGGGIVLIASLPLLLFLAAGPVAPEAVWALALLLAILNAGLFIEGAATALPLVSLIGSTLSWIVLAAWWWRAAGSVGVLASLTVLTGMTLLTLGGYAWARRQATGRWTSAGTAAGFSNGLYLGLVGHAFLLLMAFNRDWSIPPWPLFGTLTVLTLASSVVSLATGIAMLHRAAAVAAGLVVVAWISGAGADWGLVAVMASMTVSAFAVAWLMAAARRHQLAHAAGTAATVLFVGECALIGAANWTHPPFIALLIAHVATLSAILALTWRHRWTYVATGAAAASWVAARHWELVRLGDRPWHQLLALSAGMYAVFVAYPMLLGRRAGRDRDPYLAAVVASAMCFFGARAALEAGGYGWGIGAVPIALSAVLAILLRELLRIEAAGERDLGRLALIAGASLAFVTVAIPLQLHHQWITIGWALEGAALAWVYRRVPHRGLLYSGVALMTAVFVRLALNPAVLYYEPRGAMRIFNWYLYAYAICAAACFAAAWWYGPTNDRIVGSLRAARPLAAAGGILLFLLLNIEIADYYATGPAIAFRFGAGVSQDLTYTIGWLVFGMILLGIGIWMKNHAARVAAVMLIAVTTFKCFLYDLSSLAGLYRVASFVGLAISLALVSLVLQKYVLARQKGTA
jgi:uncharacterized membrane protein